MLNNHFSARLKKSIRFFTLAIILCSFATFLNSCKKLTIQDEFIDVTVNNFFNTNKKDTDLELVFKSIRNEIHKNDYRKEFIVINGYPLWDNSIKIKTSDNEFTYYVPTKKNEDEYISSFFVVQYKNGNIYSELHNRYYTDIINPDFNKFKLTETTCDKILTYFDREVLNKHDTSLINRFSKDFLQNNESFAPPNEDPDNIRTVTICWDIPVRVPCSYKNTNNNTSNLITPSCYGNTRVCINIYMIDGSPGGGGWSKWWWSSWLPLV
jgi:hypothetical protein